MTAEATEGQITESLSTMIKTDSAEECPPSSGKGSLVSLSKLDRRGQMLMQRQQM